MTKLFKIGLLLFLIFFLRYLSAQFAPAADLEGSTAIHKDSLVFVAWATGCEVVRGPINIVEPYGEKASFGDPSEAQGAAQGNSVNVVSLGDGGMATLTFDVLIVDGEGWDFAVFENALNDTFLELAFVEVSSDGEFFVRFPAISLTETSTQIPTFGEVDCTKIHNIAGKYRQGYGTPFDLAELAGTPGLDVQKITHVRIVDVVGCVTEEHASVDSEGNIINDPWPTPWDMGGFDLDGVGVINTSSEGIIHREIAFSVFPNPFVDRFEIDFFNQENHLIQVLSIDGSILLEQKVMGKSTVNFSQFPPGVYLLRIKSESKIHSIKLLKIN
jgi:hypothetical protein